MKSTQEKVGIRPPEGVKNPVWPASEANERAASRALKHEWQTYRTQAGEQRTAGRVKQLRRRSERVTRESVVHRPLFRNSERHSRKIGGRIKHSEQNTVPPEVTERQGTSTALWPRFNTSPRREYSGEGAALRPLYRGSKGNLGYTTVMKAKYYTGSH